MLLPRAEWSRRDEWSQGYLLPVWVRLERPPRGERLTVSSPEAGVEPGLGVGWQWGEVSGGGQGGCASWC